MLRHVKLQCDVSLVTFKGGLGEAAPLIGTEFVGIIKARFHGAVSACFDRFL